MATYTPLSPLPFQFQDTVTGLNAAGGSIEFFLAGTNTPTNLFSNSTGTSIGTSITLNSGGMPQSGSNVITLWRDVSIALKLILKSSSGATIAESDNLPAPIDALSTPSFPITPAEELADAVVVDSSYPAPEVYRYGTNSVPLTTDMTAAIQMSLDVMYRMGGTTLELPGDPMLFTDDLIAKISTDESSRSFRIIGKGKEVTRLVTNNGKSLKIYADTPPARAYVFVSLEIDGFSITNTGTPYTGIGLDIYSMQRSVIGDLRITGFNYGCRVRSSWNNVFHKRCQFDANNVGLKVPPEGSGQEGFNSVDFISISCANNVKAGMSIGMGSNIDVRGVLLESNPVGIYLTEGVLRCTFHNAYYENAGGGETEVSRDGVPATFLLYCGKDEDDETGSLAKPITSLTITQGMSHFGEGLIHLENCSGVWIPDNEYGNAYISMGPNVKNVRANTWFGDNRYANALVPGKSKSTARNVLRNFSQNWVPNGNFALPGKPYMAFTGSGSAAITTQTIDSKAARVLDITCPGGQTTVTASFFANGPTGAEYATEGFLVNAVMHAIASSADFASITIQLLDGSGNALTGGAVLTTGLTSLFVLSSQGNTAEVSATSLSVQVKITIERTTGTGDAHLYIDEIAVFPDAHAMLTPLSALDVDVGLSGTGTCVTLVTAWYSSAAIVTGFASESYFDVIVTPTYDGAQTTAELQVEKLTGGSAGSFKIWSPKNGAAFAYRVVPKVMRLI